MASEMRSDPSPTPGQPAVIYADATGYCRWAVARADLPAYIDSRVGGWVDVVHDPAEPPDRRWRACVLVDDLPGRQLDAAEISDLRDRLRLRAPDPGVAGAEHGTAPPFRAGDRVLHGPSGETWIVAYADPATRRVAWCGWPEGEVPTSECTLVRAATDAEHAYWLRRLRAAGGRIGRAALRLYGEPDALAQEGPARARRPGAGVDREDRVMSVDLTPVSHWS